MDEKTNSAVGDSMDRGGDQSSASVNRETSQESKGFVPMNLIDDLWPEDKEALVPEGKVAMGELFDAETESKVTPISASDLLSAPAPEPTTRVEASGSRSVAAFEDEFKNYGSESVPPLEPVSAPAPVVTSVAGAAAAEQTPEVIAASSTVPATSPVPGSAPVPEPVSVLQPRAVEPTPITAAQPTVSEPAQIPEPTPTPSAVPVQPEPEAVSAAPAAAVAARSSVAEFLKGIEEPEAAQPAPAAPEVSPVPNAIAEEAAAEAREIEERKLALARAQMGAMDSEAGAEAAGEAQVEEEPVEQGISVITREATVLGDIITQGHIDIVGRVKGNIDAKGDVAIHGIVRGDVGGSKIGLYDCRVKGNLDAALGVIVDESSIIGGDVKTKNIIFDGKVKGNIDAENVVVLRSHSLTLGDVSAASLAVEPGAILNGTVRTLVSGDLEAPFEEVL